VRDVLGCQKVLVAVGVNTPCRRGRQFRAWDPVQGVCDQTTRNRSRGFVWYGNAGVYKYNAGGAVRGVDGSDEAGVSWSHDGRRQWIPDGTQRPSIAPSTAPRLSVIIIVNDPLCSTITRRFILLISCGWWCRRSAARPRAGQTPQQAASQTGN